jgi:arylsulfatase A-like enzyme
MIEAILLAIHAPTPFRSGLLPASIAASFEGDLREKMQEWSARALSGLVVSCATAALAIVRAVALGIAVAGVPIHLACYDSEIGGRRSEELRVVPIQLVRPATSSPEREEVEHLRFVAGDGVRGEVSGAGETSLDCLAPESLGRGCAFAPISLANETRPAHTLALPHRESLCLEGAGRLADAELRLGFGSREDGVLLRLHGGEEELASIELHSEWQEFRVPVMSLEGGCLGIELEGTAGSRVVAAQPLMVRSGLRRPWVVIYVVDTLRFDQIRAQQGPVPVAPGFARFADESIFFERAMGTSSWTRPTVASLLTGLELSQHRVYGFPDRLPQGVERLSALFSDAGYETVALSTNPNIVPEWGFFEGFDRFVDLDVRVGPERERGFERLLEEALLAVDAAAGPLFLYIHDNGPHVPYQAPHSYRELFNAPAPGSPAEMPQSADDPAVLRDARRLYAAAIRATSDRFETLLEALRSAGRYDDAVVVLVGDHGEEFGEHGGLRHGETLYQEQIHIPLVVHTPGGEIGSVPHAVSTADIAPTILDYADVDPPAAFGNRRLPRPGESASEAGVLVSELDLAKNRAEVAIVWPWKYLGTSDGRERLFDLAADPLETRDVSAQHVERVAELKSALELRRLDASTGLGLTCIAGTRESAVALELIAVGGVIGSIEALGLEERDQIRVDGERVVVEFNLRPADSTRGLSPSILARMKPDRDGLRAAHFEGSAVRIGFGESAHDARVKLRAGRGDLIAMGDEAIDISELRVDAAPRGLKRGREATCTVYYVEAPGDEGEASPLDPELEERLRELGYIE